MQANLDNIKNSLEIEKTTKSGLGEALRKAQKDVKKAKKVEKDMVNQLSSMNDEAKLLTKQ